MITNVMTMEMRLQEVKLFTSLFNSNSKTIKIHNVVDDEAIKLIRF